MNIYFNAFVLDGFRLNSVLGGQHQKLSVMRNFGLHLLNIAPTLYDEQMELTSIFIISIGI